MNREDAQRIDALWQDTVAHEELNRLLNLERLEDNAREKELVSALILMAKEQYGSDRLPFASAADVAEKVMMLCGGNPYGTSLLDEDESYQVTLDMLPIAAGEDQKSALYSAHTAESILAHWYNPESTGFAPSTQRAINEFLNDDRKRALLSRLDDGTLTSPFSEEGSEAFLAQEAERLKNNASEAPEIEVDTPDIATETRATLSNDDPAVELGRLKAKVEADELKYQLVQDLRIQAQMRINQMMEANNEWVNRTVVDKLSDFINFGMRDLIDPNHLRYPRESIFSRSLSVMDSNGRVVEELLLFKRNINGPLVEFPRANVKDEVYEIAAQRCRLDGIKFPHISCTFREPQIAISFMQRTVDALLKAGYDIEDISVDRHLKTAFENHKLTIAAQKMTISEAAGMDIPDDDLQPEQDERLPEEQAIDLNTQINTPLEKLSKTLSDPNHSGGLSDVSLEELSQALERAPLLNGDPLSWNDMQTQAGLSPASRDTVERVKKHIETLINKADPESPLYLAEKFGTKQAETLRDLNRPLLDSLYGKERCDRAFDTVRKTFEKALAKQQQQPVTNELSPSAENTQSSELPVNDNEVPSYVSQPYPDDMQELPMDGPPPSPIADEDIQPPEENWEKDKIDAYALAQEYEMAQQYTDPEQPSQAAPVAEPQPGLLLTSNVTRFNCGGVNLSEAVKSQWEHVANTDLLDLSDEQLLALAAMSHKEWGQLSSVGGLSRRDAKMIERASQAVHNALAPVQPESEPISELQIRLAKSLPDNLIPAHVMKGIEPQPPLPPAAKDIPDEQQANHVRPKR